MKKYSQRTSEALICHRCGSQFFPFRSSKGMFCSNKCKFESMKIDRTMNCTGCGVSFVPKKADKKYCTHECYQSAKLSRTALDRMNEFISKTDYCWVWTGGINKNGYGRIHYAGESWVASRLMYQTMHPEEDLTDKVVRHFECDNPICVNPDHLRSGTKADNSQDMVNHKRHAHGETSYAKLKEADIPTIRADSRTSAEIAKDYGVSRRAISAVRARKSWTHI